MRTHLLRAAGLVTLAAALATGCRHVDAADGGTSTMPLTKDDVLSVRDGRFYLDGQPFAEVSFNKFDLFWQLYRLLAKGEVAELSDDHPMVAKQITALRELHESGFRTIRFFALPWAYAGPAAYKDPQKRENVFKALDKVCDIANRHGIGLVWSLGAGKFWDQTIENGKWKFGEEQLPELFGNPNSRSRKLCYEYIDEVVNRYKNNRAVVMWEIDNELTLQADIGGKEGVRNGRRFPTLKDVADFWDDIAQRIKKSDPLRLVNSGGSELRSPCQWNLYIHKEWRTDTDEEQFKAFNLLYQGSAVDVVDIHTYANNRLPGFHAGLELDGGGKKWHWADYAKAARTLGKPLMVGEFWCLPIRHRVEEELKWTPDYVEPGEHYRDHPNTLLWGRRTLDLIVDSGVQLAYVWAYSSDRPVDAEHNRLCKQSAPKLFNEIVEANKRLKAKLGGDSALKGAPSEENLDLLFSDPPNEYRIVKYQLNNKALVQYPRYGFGGYQPFFYDNLYRAGPTGPSRIGPLVGAAIAQGRSVWCADDNGYPSGSAGGKVVQNNPEYEVRGVAMLRTTGSGQVPVSIATPPDCEKMVSAVLYPMTGGVPDFSRGQVQSVQDTGVSTTGLAGDWKLCAFVLKIRDSNTQCASTAAQFRTTGRYPDLLNPNAVASWISLMHEPIIAQITDPASQLEGFYFNEPSLQQLNWHTTAYATLPWNAELFNHFQTMHGYDLQPAMGALYEGDDLYAKRVRMHFHQTVGEMLRISFTGQLAEWCEKRGLVASGHPLLEEYLRMHVANYGDMLKVVSELQVPAMDLPMPEPGQMARHNFHFPKLFSSAGVWNEHDSRVIGLLDPVIGGYGRNRKVPSEQALYIAVNGAFRCGVNLFATYINTDRYGSKAVRIFKQLNEYTGRISVMLTGARIATPVALYYPIEMFQMEYKPITARHFGKWNTPRQTAWDNLQTTMLDAEVDYNIVHPEWVRDAAIEGGELKIGSGCYRYLVMPDVEVISSKVLARIQQFEAGGGTVLWVDGKPMAGHYPSEDAQVVRAVAGVATVSAAQVPGLIPNPYDAKFTLNVTSQDSLLTTRFRRQGRSIYFLANPTGSFITAHLDDVNGGLVKVYDPVTGKITRMPLPTDVVIDAYKSCVVQGNISGRPGGEPGKEPPDDVPGNAAGRAG